MRSLTRSFLLRLSFFPSRDERNEGIRKKKEEGEEKEDLLHSRARTTTKSWYKWRHAPSHNNSSVDLMHFFLRTRRRQTVSIVGKGSTKHTLKGSSPTCSFIILGARLTYIFGMETRDSSSSSSS